MISAVKKEIEDLESTLETIKNNKPETKSGRKIKEEKVKELEEKIRKKRTELAQLEAPLADNNNTGNDIQNSQTDQEISGNQEDTQIKTGETETEIVEGEVIDEGEGEKSQENEETLQEKDRQEVKFDDKEENKNQVIVEEVDGKRDETEDSDSEKVETVDKGQILSPSRSRISARRGEKTHKQRTILLIGLTGSGKSTLGNILTEKESFNVGTETKKVGQEKFSIKNKEGEEELASTFQIIDTPDFFEKNDSPPEKLLKETLEILCKELSRLNQIFLVVSSEDFDKKDKIKKISEYYEWVASLFPAVDNLKKYFSIVITKFNEFENQTKCEIKRKELLEKLNLGGEVSFNITFVDFFAHQETNGEAEKNNNEIRKTLVENLKNCQELYTPNKEFKINFCKFLQKKTKKTTKGKTQKFE